MSLIQILSRAPVQSIDEAIAIMMAIDESLPDSDGVKWFNRLYLRVTVSVGAAVSGARFNDAAFLTKLDVVFANLYFSALAASSAGIGAAPSAWRPLLQARNTPGIARIQFALAGMNAHINRDLPDGIVQSFLALGGDPIADHLREQDFDSVNDILERVEEEVKTEFTVGVVGVVDRLGGRPTTRWRCGRCERRAAPRGRTRRCSGACAASRACATDSLPSSTAWLAWQGAACSCRAIPPSSGSRGSSRPPASSARPLQEARRSGRCLAHHSAGAVPCAKPLSNLPKVGKSWRRACGSWRRGS